MATLTGRMTGAMQADVKTFQEIEADPTAMNQAIAVIVIAGVASLIGNMFRIGIMHGVMMLVANLIGYALWTLLVVLIGTKLMPEPTTKADFNEGFRVIGFTASPGVFNVLAIVPFLGPLISFVVWIWMVVVGVVAVREVLDYSNTGRAIIVCLIAAVICWIVLFFVLVPLLLGIFTINATCSVSSTILGASMMADVVEHSEDETGRRSEGVFFAGAFFIQKCTSGLGIFVAGSILAIAGFPEAAKPGTVPVETVDRLTILFAALYLSLGFAAAFLYRRFPFGKDEHLARVERLAANG